MISISKALALSIAAASLSYAASVHFVGVPTGTNDGVYYVTPYEITIDGTSQLVTCYDIFDDVNFGDTWEANIFTIDQAIAGGYFAGSSAGYKRVAWLDAQTWNSSAQEVGLQHAIWDVFGSSPAKTPETQTYEAAADAAAANAWSGFDFSHFRFVEQQGGTVGHTGTEQAFVFELPSTSEADSSHAVTVVAPEPNTFRLWALGVITGIGYLRRRSC